MDPRPSADSGGGAGVRQRAPRREATLKPDDYDALPLIFSCSGCSNIAQLANSVAIELDRETKAEMSCIAGVGGGVKALVKKARSGRTIIALDGCPLHCVANCLSQQDVVADFHYTLTDQGFKKAYHDDCDADDVARVKAKILGDLNSTNGRIANR
jgi:uncharacterized metal-binding protein